VRGGITSHRVRSTIATQLYNAKEPMTLFELQAWLGHKDPATTQRSARKDQPNTLSKAYTEAGYFARNVRTIEVLLDRDAVTSGAATGQPWQHYDLGHGWCSYSFFEQCQHRMASARCDFYTPKQSSKAQLLEASNPAAHARQHPAHRRRTRRRRRRTHRSRRPARPARRRPRPAGPTPRELGAPASVTLLPVVQMHHL
jgi:hypothetical protein